MKNVRTIVRATSVVIPNTGSTQHETLHSVRSKDRQLIIVVLVDTISYITFATSSESCAPMSGFTFGDLMGRLVLVPQISQIELYIFIVPSIFFSLR